VTLASLDSVLSVDGAARLAELAFSAGGLVELDRESLLGIPARVGAARALVIVRRGHGVRSGGPRLAQILEGTTRIAALAIEQQLALIDTERAQAARRRTELARSIHEDVMQSMFGVNLVLADDGALAAPARRACSAEMDRALANLRTILRRDLDLAPPSSGTQLQAYLAELADAGVHIDAELDADLGASAEHQAVVRAVLAEALCNARKHGSPASIRVELRQLDEMLQLKVTNDCVHDMRCSKAPGVGLQLATTEAAQVGGLFEYGPDGRGSWAVRLVLPMEERDDYRIDCVTVGGRRR
jgi:signal transduction histidine kinase